MEGIYHNGRFSPPQVIELTPHSLYADEMNHLAHVQNRGVTAVIGTPPEKALLEAMTQLALMGNVSLIDSAEQFDKQLLADEVRQNTSLVDETMARVRVIRPFTCHQVVQHLEESQPTSALILLNFLILFYVETLPDSEAVRLVRSSVTQIRRLGRQVPVVLTVKPAPLPQRTGLLKFIRGVAHQVYVFESPSDTKSP